jgi:hypothetical protein
MDHTEPLQTFQRLNIIPTRPSPAHDEARAASVNTVELGTPWHIIECLYFLFSLLNNSELSDLVSMATQPFRITRRQSHQPSLLSNNKWIFCCDSMATGVISDQSTLSSSHQHFQPSLCWPGISALKDSRHSTSWGSVGDVFERATVDLSTLCPHHGARETSTVFGRSEKEHFIVVLTANNGDLFCVESHGSSSSFDDDILPWLCQHPSAFPSAVWPSPWWSSGPIQGNGDAELKPDDAENGEEAGGQTAAPNLALRPSKDGDSCWPTLQSSGRVRVLRTMEKFDNYLRTSLRKTAGLALFGFCHRFAQIGN